MLRNIVLVVVVAIIAFGCQTNETQSEQQTVAVTIAEFNANPDQYLDQVLALQGTVDHVCKHGGKRMFIMGDTPEERLKIETTDQLGPFAVELEGSDVTVTGMVKVLKMDAAYLDNWEAEARAEHEAPEVDAEHEAVEGEGEHEAVEGEADDHHQDLESVLAEINALRQEMTESGNGYVAFYSLECKSYEEVAH